MKRDHENNDGQNTQNTFVSLLGSKYVIYPLPENCTGGFSQFSWHPVGRLWCRLRHI